MIHDCAVVGAGIHGLCAAFWLRQSGKTRIVVIDRFGPGHDRGSSHGALRITRSSYHEPQFVRLAAAAQRDGWPALERALGKPLRVPTPGVFGHPHRNGARHRHEQRRVLAAGASVAQLSPGHGGPLTVLHQQVGYFDVDADPAELEAGTFPVWARIGRLPNDCQYGLPAHDGAGLKAAQHRTAGPHDDPSALPPPIDRQALLALAAQRFTAPVRSLLLAEQCLYTMTRDQGFHVASSPHDRRIVGIAACSGHGFKFGPVIGRMAADAALAAL